MSKKLQKNMELTPSKPSGYSITNHRTAGNQVIMTPPLKEVNPMGLFHGDAGNSIIETKILITYVLQTSYALVNWQ